MTKLFVKSRPPKTAPTSGMIMSLTRESTILPKAAPMITPTARSTTFPFSAKSRNSLANDMSVTSELVIGTSLLLHRCFAALSRTNAYHLLHFGDEDLAVADLACARSLDHRI